MKKLAVLLFALLCSTAVFAQVGYPGAPVIAETFLNISVINPLSVTAPTAPTLPVVIDGTSKTFATAIPVVFTITGNEGCDIDVTTSTSVTVSGGVTLLGGWGTAPAQLSGTAGGYLTGTATHTFTITGLDANGEGHAPGTVTFKLEVRAEYTNL